eukprot:Plantae.Rhodophyta-Hildenbrandia_rubra.ctg328.p1 GENE.Plantae.Rhodophyta-Hildenbrandia_rubra.ctg328~~Plantae.Rhodophyta-Hildenbrandia_rubra.ctg328.p1  ORF type:complete len:538 (+),score=102.95 Plantae.Rhodophyta-Hildenbrandia_rubra.ctg328:1574-3187(+)
MEVSEKELLISIQFRGEIINARAKLSWTVLELKTRLEEQTSIPVSLQKLLFRKRLLSDEILLKQLDLKPGAKMMLMGASWEAANAIKEAKPDPLVRGFSSHKAKGTSSLRQSGVATLMPYGFGEVQELPGYSDAWKARELLQRITKDRQVVAVMQSRKWKVGVLKEMEPEGKVGEDPVCVLGLNYGKGAEIHLRLRTDDKKGFRPYYKIKEVLWHELSHNVFSEHDAKFYALMREIEKEGKQLDWTESAGRSVDGKKVEMAPAAPDPLDEEDDLVGTVARLGGVDTHNDLQSSIVQAAEKRQKAFEAKESSQQLEMQREANSNIMPVHQKETSQSRGKRKASDVAPDRPKATDQNSGADTKAPTLRLQEMGYSAVASRLAWRNARGDFARAVEWLVTYESSSAGRETAQDWDDREPYSMEKQIAYVESERRIKLSLEALKRELPCEHYPDVLEILYVYIDNLARDPNSPKFSTIKQSNKVFQTKVGVHESATDILKAVGWKLHGDKWIASSLNLDIVWGAKRLLMDKIMRTSCTPRL